MARDRESAAHGRPRSARDARPDRMLAERRPTRRWSASRSLAPWTL